ncbi:MAG: ABC transporter ATP-binding protein [Nitrospirae bacterium]|nr:ABC transporter ATP-binding protein [Nitrospirota bacterium]
MSDAVPSAAPAAPLLSARGITRAFSLKDGAVSVLNGVDVDVHRGELVAIVGASGTGKSTLLSILGTLDEPSAGTVTFEGRDLFGLDAGGRARFRNRRLGFVFQFNQLLPEFSALENAAMPLLLRREAGAHDKARALLARVGLAHRLDHRPAELSGGEQQRVAIARALVGRPDLILADEPTGNLDQHTGDRVFDLLAELARDQGAAVLIVTHNDHLAARCGRILRMVDGLLGAAA